VFDPHGSYMTYTCKVTYKLAIMKLWKFQYAGNTRKKNAWLARKLNTGRVDHVTGNMSELGSRIIDRYSRPVSRLIPNACDCGIINSFGSTRLHIHV